ncbi:hypothetical protein NBT05_15780 [Aquimarina sp. ERC-38]|uniref:hypothetical protein n=1 Tax=Aquimarina sp. ERC-38 TaxID=2949996 RepID=UPI00224593C2|nr:hypothetical protein [Aquimarina sp. ERC-38]UZO80401.1 hypothetical protein NBT05_15780 [Aquimarina sp. ERC-38]
MPQKIRSLVLICICFLAIARMQSQDFNCSNLDNTGFIDQAFETFEKDLYNHYQSFSSDPIKVYRKFLTEVASLSIDLRKIPSKDAIDLARLFKTKTTSTNSIWVKLSDYESNEATDSSSPYTNPKKDNKEEIYTFNYRGGFIQCLKNTSNSEDFKDIVTILENDGNISTSLIAQRLYYMTDAEILKSQVKKFVAFDIYYSILMVIERAFG